MTDPGKTTPVAGAVASILRWATGRRVIQSTLVGLLGGYVLFNYGPYSEVRALAGPLPEESITSPVALYAYLDSLGTNGRELYGTFQLWDFLNPLAIGLIATTLVGWLLGRSGVVRGRTVAMVIPFVGPAADAVENLLLLNATAAFPDMAWGARLFPLVTSAKFFGLVATVVLIVWLSALAIRRRYAS